MADPQRFMTVLPTTRRVGRVALLGCLVAAASAQAQGTSAPSATHRAAGVGVWDLHVDEPRGFGWFVGDRVSREIRWAVPDGWVPDMSSLPRTDARGGPVEIVAVDWRSDPKGGEWTARLRVDYQLFVAPDNHRLVDLPGFTVRFNPRRAGDAVRTVQVVGGSVLVAPLVTSPVPSAAAWGAWRPDFVPPAISSASWQHWRNGGLGLAALAALGLLGRPLLESWWRQRALPLARARRGVLAALAEGVESEDLRLGSVAGHTACRQLHAGLDAWAGGALLRDEARVRLGREPAFASLVPEVDAFFVVSRSLFFGVEGADAPVAGGYPLGRLRALVEALAAAERAVWGRAPEAPVRSRGAR